MRKRHTAMIAAALAITAATVAACGGGDVEIKVESRQDTRSAGIGPSVHLCAVNLAITNNGSAKLERLSFRLVGGSKKSGFVNMPDMAIGRTIRETAFFKVGGCDQLPSSLALEMSRCTIGDRDCTKDVSLTQ